MPASLFVVSTPIGNLDDITLRALNVLKSVTLIAAEDTRRTGTLLRHFGIPTPTTSYHVHNEQQKTAHLVERLRAGESIALVSDAGTPLIADPGNRLVAATVAAGIAVVPIPGPSSVMAALVVSALPTEEFFFAGFAPARSNDRSKWLKKIALLDSPIVFFEAPHRIQKTLTAIPLIFGDRPIIICRELTKLHEQVIRTTTARVGELHVMDRGEFVIVIGAAVQAMRAVTYNEADVYNKFCRLTNNGAARRSAMSLLADEFGLSTNQIYAIVERQKSLPPS
jgi:16S rRNA (cytidine1402-2'-O)-methyltransferase